MSERQKTSARRGGTFDAFEVARRGATLSGTVDVAKMPRVADRLVQDEEEGLAPGAEGRAQAVGATKVAWRITGIGDPQGRPALEIELHGAVPLECQRCVQPFMWPIDQHTTLLLARDERELAALDAGEDTLEVILADAPQETLTLIEDEVLLALPFAPRCERPGCAGEPMHSHDPDMPRASAFAALAGLKDDGAK
jgi:uncharacterized protein